MLQDEDRNGLHKLSLSFFLSSPLLDPTEKFEFIPFLVKRKEKKIFQPSTNEFYLCVQCRDLTPLIKAQVRIQTAACRHPLPD